MGCYSFRSFQTLTFMSICKLKSYNTGATVAGSRILCHEHSSYFDRSALTESSHSPCKDGQENVYMDTPTLPLHDG